MWNIPSGSSLGFYAMTALAVAAGALIFGAAYAQNRGPASGDAAAGNGKAPGLAFESVQVSDLKKSIDYYRLLGFEVAGEADPPWTLDEAANRLYNTPGAMSRRAALTIASAGSGRPFTLYLQQFRGIDRSGRADFPARHPSATHIGVTEPQADELWAELQKAGTLRALSWDGKLIRMPGQTSGGLAYVMDPDGFNIEIIGLNPVPKEGASGQAAPSHSPALHHLGLVVKDSDIAESFYGGLLGAVFPEGKPEWLSGDMYDSVVGGHGYIIRLINGTFPEVAAPNTGMHLELVEYRNPARKDIADYRYSDVAASCIGFQVEGLDALYSRLKAAGVKIWSKGGVVQKKDGTRAVVVRDPDVGAFVELFEIL